MNEIKNARVLTIGCQVSQQTAPGYKRVWSTQLDMVDPF